MLDAQVGLPELDGKPRARQSPCGLELEKNVQGLRLRRPEITETLLDLAHLALRLSSTFDVSAPFQCKGDLTCLKGRDERPHCASAILINGPARPHHRTGKARRPLQVRQHDAEIGVGWQVSNPIVDQYLSDR